MKCILIGGGGHGRVLLEVVQQQHTGVIVGVLDSQPGLLEVAGVQVLGGDERLPDLKQIGFTHFVIGVGSAKSCVLRAKLHDEALKHGLMALTIIHPTAWVAPSAQIGVGSQILAKAVVNTGAKLKAHVLVNTAALVEHDCVVGTHTHIATGAILCGDVHVGEAVHIGAGAVIRQGIHIGARSVVGAGAVVVQDVPEDTVVVGVPARPLK